MKIFKSTSPGIRHKIKVNEYFLDKTKKLKNHTTILKKLTGHNNTGQITVRGKIKKHKVFYRKLKPLNIKYIPYILNTLEYNPNNNNYINKVNILNLCLKYYPSILNKLRGDVIYNNSKLIGLNKLGFSYKLNDIKLNLQISNIFNNKKYKLSKAAGSYTKILNNFNDSYSYIQHMSKKKSLINNHYFGIIGQCSNLLNNKEILGKAGANYHLGFKSKVRGVAMNPVDHPHGGGEGKSSGGRCSVSKWGLLTKGKKTRKNKKAFILNNLK